ncbi:hypothetical protein OIDMADRAFT_102977 [Oidiodendron maius Zn]|uniref:Ornithine carbamoyltransferase, mitochondrial n=1 Tax=Oidiodendron maius (strain Zn) TaxID=913774 RepID=A0A0C3H0E6_OIDMZ|nr:hypothetical protein OIDMADRAFT_102977 [Oidiodendron maius Zn]
MMFNKRSTRTQVSAEAAVATMGGHSMFLGKDDIQLGVNEALYDTSLVISSMTSCMVARVGPHSDVADLAKHSSVPVINALSNDYHLSKSSLISLLYTSLGLEGMKIAWIGDSNNVLFDPAMGCLKLGVDISVASPEGYKIPLRMREIILSSTEGVSQPGKLIETNVHEEAIKDADILVTDTFGSMGQEEETAKRHPEEVADEVFYSPRSLVFTEAENRLWAAISALDAFVVNKGKII